MVVKAHYITIGGDHIGVLLILPAEIAANGFEEVFVHHILRPASRIANDPVQFSTVKVNVHHGVNVTAGEG